MSATGIKENPERRDPLDPIAIEEYEDKLARERQAQILRTLWERRRLLRRAAVVGLLVSALIAVLIPKTYTSTAQLMPPDQQGSNGLAMMAALAGKTLGGLAGLTSEVLGMKSSGAMFVGVLKSETSQERIVQEFDLKRVYGQRLVSDARKRLDDNTTITEDRKSGIITIAVTDHDPQRAAAIANAYVDELNELVAQLSTSAAHRERVFLEDRLKLAKLELDDAANQLAQFSSKNNTLDIQIEGRAMLEAASTMAGQLIAAESQLEGLRQIYTDNNARVRALQARVAQLRKELERFGGSGESVPRGNHPSAGNPGLLQTGDPPIEKTGSVPFPTIRNLPILGAKYADYYRRAKIQETVFELLTEQYELAKVQEAKETPSVKVLDPGRVPDKKSFPPRLLLALGGMLLVVAGTSAFVVGRQRWVDVDPNDPRKILAMDVAATMRASRNVVSSNGNTDHSRPGKLWSRFTNRNGSETERSDS